MPAKYWLIQPNGLRHPIDSSRYDLGQLAERARKAGWRLVTETSPISRYQGHQKAPRSKRQRRPKLTASTISTLFRDRLEQIHQPLIPFDLDVNTRPTIRVLGGYYRQRRLVRVYSHDRKTGLRPLEELFETFLHEVAHHLEYTEPHRFNAKACERVRGTMHSALFWRIFGQLRDQWDSIQQDAREPS